MPTKPPPKKTPLPPRQRKAAPTKASAAQALEAELLAGVIVAPEDDAPRLVYADHLLEHGDARGEFIHLQLVLRRSLQGGSGYATVDASHLPPPNHLELERREIALLKKHAKDWVAPVRSAIRSWYWKRGFLDDITAGPSFFEGHNAEELLRRHPVTAIRFEGMTARAFDALATTAFGSIREITIYGRQLNSKTARYLTGANLEALTSLVITYSEIGAEGLALLANSRLRGLRHLSISGNFGDAGLAALASSTAFESLETLDLLDPEITDRGLETFAATSHFPRLRSVTPVVPNYYSPEDMSWSGKGIRALAKRFGE